MAGEQKTVLGVREERKKTRIHQRKRERSGHDW